jgi:Uma2 family endonuclease
MITAEKTNLLTFRTLHQWRSATWLEYIKYRDDPQYDRWGLFFDRNQLLLIDMGWEGINHAAFNDLMIMVFGFWFMHHPGLRFTSLGRCLLEKPGEGAGAPDLVLYVGEKVPQWQPGEKRRIDLSQWRVPDLVGEIADTTLATDLDEKKQLYAKLGIPEYWVVDVLGKRVFAFRLTATDSYEPIAISQALLGLSIGTLEQTFTRLQEESNGNAALWFAQQIASTEPQH